MLAIVQAYIDIALLRRGPQSLPPSSLLLWLTVLALSFLAFVPAPGQRFTTVQTAIIFSLDVLMVCSVIWLLLNAKERSERFVQTMTAIFGAELVLTVAKLSVMFVFADSFAAARDGQSLDGPQLVAFGLESWSMVVLSAILRAALGVTILQSIGIIVLILMLFLGAVSFILPAVGAGG